jgi:hypothetical protein
LIDDGKVKKYLIVDTKGKIYLPASYEINKNLPAIYLIDY